MAEAAKMLEALGGRERWASLASLYIRATHVEKGIPKPYRSEIWRNLDGVQFKIVQQNADYHQTVFVNGREGWLIHNGEMRALTQEQLAGLLRWDKHLVYKTIRKIALGGRGIGLKLDGGRRLEVYENGERLATLELDGQRRPSKYYTPAPDGKADSLTVYTAWGVSDGYVHPTVSEPQGLEAVYRAEVWKPSSGPSAVEFTPPRPRP
ncbi:MAG TPA: hypothetical protein VIP46_10300 [Pyrinomonadaceae bacterium]